MDDEAFAGTCPTCGQSYLQAEITRLLAALKPFAEAGGSMSARHNDFHGALSALCLNDLRRAHEAFTVIKT